ncbi:MAG TPA: MarR family transcriptional regulator, partial [bacterium]|nr:MarR family transcriptional regulator [bacterium]
MAAKRTAPSPEPKAPLDIPRIVLERMAFLLIKNAFKLREMTEEALKPHGLIGKHWGILTTLKEKGSLTQHDIGRCVHMDRSTMVMMIDDLEKAGLVERRPNPADRRAHSIHVTERGKVLWPELNRLVGSAEKRFLAVLSAKEQK